MLEKSEKVDVEVEVRFSNTNTLVSFIMLLIKLGSFLSSIWQQIQTWIDNDGALYLMARIDLRLIITIPRATDCMIQCMVVLWEICL